MWFFLIKWKRVSNYQHNLQIIRLNTVERLFQNIDLILFCLQSEKHRQYISRISTPFSNGSMNEWVWKQRTLLQEIIANSIILKIFKNQLGQFQPNLTRNIREWRRFKFVQFGTKHPWVDGIRILQIKAHTLPQVEII